MRVLVVSDTHIPSRGTELPRDLLKALDSGPDMVLHAGDLTSATTLEYFEGIPGFVGVEGNMDPPDIGGELPRERIVEVSGLKVGILHGDGPGKGPEMFSNLASWFEDVDVVVSGHTHVPHFTVIDGIYLFNPGSCTDPRGGSAPSFGWIDLERGGEPSFSVVPLGGRVL